MPVFSERELLAVYSTMGSAEQLCGWETIGNSPARITLPRPKLQRSRLQNPTGELALASGTVSTRKSKERKKCPVRC